MNETMAGDAAKKERVSEDSEHYGNTRRQLDRQSEHIYRLDATIDKLQDRLNPILVEYDPKPLKAEDVETLWMPPVPDSIRLNNDKLDLMIVRLMDLIDRIDL